MILLTSIIVTNEWRRNDYDTDPMTNSEEKLDNDIEGKWQYSDIIGQTLMTVLMWSNG